LKSIIILHIFLTELQNLKEIEDSWVRLGEVLLKKIPINFLIHLSSYFLVDIVFEDLITILPTLSCKFEIVQNFIKFLSLDHTFTLQAIERLKHFIQIPINKGYKLYNKF